MVRVSKSIGHFRREPPDLLFRKWIATLTRRAIVDQRRRSARRIPPIDFEKPFTHRFVLTLRTLLHLPSDESNPDFTDSGYRKIVQSVLESVRDKVQPAQWEAFTLTTIENLSADEVGRLLNLKPENIRKIAERVRSAILERICELLNQESDSVTL
jgi:RNA polymerase sigma factor (sigma-70 family)